MRQNEAAAAELKEAALSRKILDENKLEKKVKPSFTE